MTVVELIAICGFLPHYYEHAPLTQRCAFAFQDVVCSRRETHRIRNNDPALILFRHRGYPLVDAKIQLADERTNSCDFPASPAVVEEEAGE